MEATGRTAFLQRVRDAVQAGNSHSPPTPLPRRGQTGYQGAGPDPLARFCDELRAAGGQAHVAAAADAADRILDLVRAKAARRVLLGSAAVLDRLQLADRLRAGGAAVATAAELTTATCQEPFFAADLGITGVDYLVAETGSVVLASRAVAPRSLSLLPPVHIAVAERAQIVPDLFDLFAALEPSRATLPSGLAIITGPSKTGDIELKLVTGVHGPGEIHVVVIDPGH